MSVGIAGAIHRQSNRAEAMIILVIDKIGIFDRGRFHRKGNDLRKQMKRWYREEFGEEIRASPKPFLSVLLLFGYEKKWDFNLKFL